MANITAESRSDFQEKSKSLKEAIEATLKKEKDITQSIKQNSTGAEYKKLLLCEDMIYVATLYIAINNTSVKLLETKNNDALNDARKSIYKAIIYLEEVVSNVVDCPYSELDDKLSQITNFPVEKRYYVIRKLGLVIDLLVDAFGDNSKWKWSFVEMRGRFSVVAKNLINMKDAVKDYFEPQAPDHDVTVMYVRLIKSLMEKSSSEYRDKYELSTRRIDDMRMAINYLISLRRISLLLGESEQAEEIKKKALVWRGKMEADQKAGSSK